MTVIRHAAKILSLSRTALRRLGAEDGIAIPVTMGVLALTILVAGVAHSQSNDATTAANEDRRSKRAIQAADAGLQAATYHMNLLDVTQNGNKCVSEDLDGKLHRVALGTSQEWCGAIEGDLADGASYSYRVSRETCYSGSTTVDCSSSHTRRARTVVSTGTVDAVKRRVASTVEGYTAQPLFPQPWAVFSDQNLSMNSNAVVDGNAGSNGNIEMNGSNAKVCDEDGSGNTANATPGPGKSVTPDGAYVCGSKAPALAPWIPPPVQANNFADEDNDNDLLGPSTQGCNNDVCWDPVTHRLELKSNSSVTLSGSVYSFCYLKLDSNSKLVVPAGNTVTIYIEPPERCTALPATERGNVEFLSNSSILNQNTSPNTLQFYVSGSTNTATTVKFDSNFQQSGSTAWPFMVYAPLSNVSLLSNTKIQGAVVGKTVLMDSNAEVRWDPAIADVTTGAVFPLLRHTAYRECSSAPPADGAPADGC